MAVRGDFDSSRAVSSRQSVPGEPLVDETHERADVVAPDPAEHRPATARSTRPHAPSAASVRSTVSASATASTDPHSSAALRSLEAHAHPTDSTAASGAFTRSAKAFAAPIMIPPSASP